MEACPVSEVPTPHLQLQKIRQLIARSPEIWLGYNADGDLVEIRKNVDGKWFKRSVKLVGVTDFTVDTWDKFEGWEEV